MQERNPFNSIISLIWCRGDLISKITCDHKKNLSIELNDPHIKICLLHKLYD